MPFEDKISTILNSEAIIEKINRFPESSRDMIIGSLIQYLILFPNSDETTLDTYCDSLLEETSLLDSEDMNGLLMKKEQMLKQAIIEALNIEESAVEEPNNISAIYHYIYNAYIKNGYYFHSFNGVFEESIRTEGLSKDTRFWDWNDVDRIQEICSKAGYPLVCGWSKLNSKGKISLGDDPNNIYRYANTSPEWFVQFVAHGFHIQNKPPYDKKAFYKKDYAAARQNIERWCDRMESHPETPINSDERQEILNFFDKYWPVFTKESISSPRCALVARTALDRGGRFPESFEEYKSMHEQLGTWRTPITVDFIVGTLLFSSEPDFQIDTNISPDTLKIISLPEYAQVHPD
jgi:hypothetical protein